MRQPDPGFVSSLPAAAPPRNGASALAPLAKTTWAILLGWLLIFGSYFAVAVAVPKGPRLTAFGDIFQCAAALFACVGLFLNATSSASTDRRSRAFWGLIGLGCLCWLSGQILWTYFELGLHQEAPNPFAGDIVIFLHPVPMIAALSLKPHDRRDDVSTRVRSLDFGLLLLWWVYLYLFIVIPWQFISPNLDAYGVTFDYLQAIENFVVVIGFGVMLGRAKRDWRPIYGHLFGASLVYAIGSYVIDRVIDANRYYTGSAFDLPLIAALIWFGTAGLVAYSTRPQHDEESAQSHDENPWPARLAALTVFSIPLMALWSAWSSRDASSIRLFRASVTQIALLIAGFLLFLRQRIVNKDRLRLLLASRDAFESLKQFQAQLIQNEKLVSIGQLAAGAAHEINNPLTGILGYSDLLAEDPTLAERPRATADKIRTLARRIKAHVTSLLSFARRVPSEKAEIDVNVIVSTALNLTGFDVHGKNIEIVSVPDPETPPVMGDANQILQVCFNLISNAVDAMEEIGGGRLTIRTLHRASKAIIEISDTGPGIAAPLQVFDPFYTTKPVGKGTGLGLSICYGIVQDHNGHIFCFNRPEGGATFVVEFPLALRATGAAMNSVAPAQVEDERREEPIIALQAVNKDRARRPEED
jgi:signal transduction histidine kinase